ncbi:MAG: nucleoside hydrolase [Ignavibacteriota bacterium]
MPQAPLRNAPPGAFFDSDFSTVDDLLAVSLLYGLQTKGDCRVAILSVNRPNLAVTGFVDAVQRFYHGPAANFAQLAAIGMPTSGAAGDTPPALVTPFQRTKADGSPVYKNQVKSAIDTGDPCTLLRNYLEAQADKAAFVILAGPATNLAAALAFRGLKPLIAAKCRMLAIAGGAFPDGPAEPHMQADPAAAKQVLAEWPTPIVASGVEVGAALPFPGASIDKQFAESTPDNPVADAYRAWKPMPYDTPSWAMAAALHAARPNEGYFKLSDPGRIALDDRGRTSFTPAENGTHRYLIVDPRAEGKNHGGVCRIGKCQAGSAAPPRSRTGRYSGSVEEVTTRAQ